MTERRRGVPFRHQLRNATPLLFVWSVAGLIVLAAGVQSATPIEFLFLDPAQLTGSPWYTGLLSNVGILSWTVALTAACGGAWVARLVGRATAATFLASGAVVTLVVLADDLLQLRAVALPTGGVHPSVARLLVTVPVVVWGLSQRREIARTRWMLLVGAMAGFGVSLGADTFLPLTGDSPTRLFIEDGAKLFGVVAWAQYFVVTTLDITRSTVTGREHPAPVAAPIDRRQPVG